jgi:hypothetical protein
MIHDTVEDWWLNDLAYGILSLYESGNCGHDPVSEWTFNVYPLWSRGLAGFTDYVGRQAKWAMSLPSPIGKPLFVGAWILGFAGRADDVPNDHPDYIARLREAKTWLFGNPNIRTARYLLFEPWPVENSDPHPLADASGNLNATGRAYAEVTGRIAGPTSIPPSTTCLWTAETTGGAPPFSYEWLVDGVRVSQRHWLVHAQTPYPSVVQLRVTDANGGESIVTRNVSVNIHATSCAP